MTNTKTPITVGIIAHVDSGKTTLSEAILYLTGEIRKLGRVDNQDAFLDTYALERARGITIFSKLAQVKLGETSVTLLDTPGHMDFSAEMERTLQVLDYAILVVSGADGVQGHTLTLWRLLERYQIPTVLFVNKMDQDGTNREKIIEGLQQKLSENCLDFGQELKGDFLESLAMCEESVLEKYLEYGDLKTDQVQKMILDRHVFPCYFGSALKLIGVEEFLHGLETYLQCPTYGEEFGAKVFKIARDEGGNRLTYLKITGGKLKVKEMLDGEKVNQIRIYSGAGYEAVSQVEAGMVCAVTGLSKTYPGHGFGKEKESMVPVLEPVLTYQIQLPRDCNVHGTLQQLHQLEEEEPQLHIVWNEQLQEIQAQLMGEVQIEILKSLIKERFDLDVEFGTGHIVYKETIKNTVEGVGHYEPLRHYAEVHLRLEPGETGSGLIFDTECSEDVLDRNWQRLILTHLEEKEHLGVLTGFPITDMKLTLTTGRAHQKHTEGGDFRQSTYRAVRQGLKKAESILLEPYYSYRLSVPPESVGRAMTDVERMHGSFSGPEPEGAQMVLCGEAPVATMRDYQIEVTAYTHGQGNLTCVLAGYKPCHNMEEVVERIGYDSERDLENPTGSVFCSHGAGELVPWNEVDTRMHLESTLGKKSSSHVISASTGKTGFALETGVEGNTPFEYVTPKTVLRKEGARKVSFGESSVKEREKEQAEEYLLVDGYNVIYAWKDLKELAEVNMDAARGKLQDMLCNYQGYKKCKLIIVYDAYLVSEKLETVENYHNIQLVFTKEAQTADQYIEKTAHEMGKTHHVTVATSDGVEQVIIRGQGCSLLSSRELRVEVERIKEEIRREHMGEKTPEKTYLFDAMPEEMIQDMEAIRLGKREFGEQRNQDKRKKKL